MYGDFEPFNDNKSKGRPNTGGVGGGLGAKRNAGGGVDAWGRDNFDDLDDFDDKPKTGAAGLANKVASDKKRALFGLGGADETPAYDPTAATNQRKGRFDAIKTQDRGASVGVGQQSSGDLKGLALSNQNSTSKSVGRQQQNPPGG